MENIHCNSCNHIPHLPGVPQRRYFISSCGHVFCVNCVQQNENHCSVCKAEKIRFQEVNQNARPDIKAYFMDPMAVLRENLKQTTQVLNFQRSQAKSYQGCVAKLYEAYKSVMQDRDAYKHKLETMTQERDALQHKVDEMTQEQQSWMGNANNNGMNFMQQQAQLLSTPAVHRHAFFGDMRNPCTPSDSGTPFNITSNGPQMPLFSPATTPGSAGRRPITPVTNGSGGRTLAIPPLGSGGKNSAFLLNGRLTVQRTPGPGGTPQMRSNGSEASQHSQHQPTQDIVSRLRQLQRPSMSSMCETPPGYKRL